MEYVSPITTQYLPGCHRRWKVNVTSSNFHLLYAAQAVFPLLIRGGGSTLT